MNLSIVTSSRVSWALLSFFSFSCVGAALYFQHVIGLEPCYLCILQRIAFLIIGFGSLITLFNPKNHIFRKFGYLSWFGGGSLGLYSGGKLIHMQSQPPEMFSSCSMGTDQLMENFSFIEYLPMLFNGSGDCAKSSGSFIGVTFEQWTLGLFVVITLSLFLIIAKRVKERL
jgi:disulfide bond formation protein DsbB